MPGKLVALICRHGETKLNANNCFRGWIDVPLDEIGEQQAQAAAEFLSQFPIQRVISSPLFRAVVTAETFALPANLPITQDRGLLPWHVGVLSGTDKGENMPALKLFVENAEIKIPNGESLQEFEERAYEFYDRELRRAKTDGLTVFFAHTSNVTVLENLVRGERGGEPETGETVKPGGVCAIYATADGYEIEPVFGKPEPANYGS